MTSKSKKTATLTLVLIASVSLTACKPNQTHSRAVYRNLSDCSLEWGGADYCEHVTDGSYPVWYYYGPCYSKTEGKIYYYQGTNTEPLNLPANASILKNSQARPILSVNEDICEQSGTIPEAGKITCDNENTTCRPRRTTPRISPFTDEDENDYAAPSGVGVTRGSGNTTPRSGRATRGSGKASRGGFGSTARGGSKGG